MISQSWKCEGCGFVTVGLFPPEHCPRCTADRSSFQKDYEFKFPEEEIGGVIAACFKVSYGLYMISSREGEKVNGQICNTLFQVTADPPRFAVAINHDNLTHEFMEKSGVFAVSILGVNDHRIVRRFGYRSGRDFDKFKGIPVITGRTDCPVYRDAIGYIECEILTDKTVDAGTHSVFIGDLVGGKVLRDEEPMTYSYFRETKDKQ
ncbi:MAG: flavin reductase [Candidatus Krumholzibacteriota bacterium]|nr:flavin reductase [Candidatus Krumholzibacteriota bacterium]